MTTFNLSRNTGVFAGQSITGEMTTRAIGRMVNISGIIAANSGTTTVTTTDLVNAVSIPPHSFVFAIGAIVTETNVSGTFTISAAGVTHASGHMATSGYVVNTFEAGAQVQTVVASATGAFWTTGSAVDVVFTFTSGALTTGKVWVYAIVQPLWGGQRQ